MQIEQTALFAAPLHPTWNAWLSPGELTRWFAPKANIEPALGGAYELFFNPADPAHDSTIGCRITKLEPHAELAFTWKGPSPLAAVMNQDEERLTRVHITFQAEGEQTRVTLLHTGWGEGPEWERAREWHVKAWEMMLQSLRRHLANGGAKRCPCCS